MRLEHGHFHYVPLATDPDTVKKRFAGELGPLSKRVVPMPSDEERRAAQGACVYGCRQGHSWLVFVVRESLVRAGGDPSRWLAQEDADRYCVECEDVSDDEALGKKLSAVRHWTICGRRPLLPPGQPVG